MTNISSEKINDKELDLKLLALVHTLRPFEEIRIKKDGFGKTGKIIILSSSTTILDYGDEELNAI